MLEFEIKRKKDGLTRKIDGEPVEREEANDLRRDGGQRVPEIWT